jgi:hypothetical protein
MAETMNVDSFVLLRKPDEPAFRFSARQTVHLEEERFFGAVSIPGRQPNWTT